MHKGKIEQEAGLSVSTTTCAVPSVSCSEQNAAGFLISCHNLQFLGAVYFCAISMDEICGRSGKIVCPLFI